MEDTTVNEAARRVIAEWHNPTDGSKGGQLGLKLALALADLEVALTQADVESNDELAPWGPIGDPTEGLAEPHEPPPDPTGVDCIERYEGGDE